MYLMHELLFKFHNSCKLSQYLMSADKIVDISFFLLLVKYNPMGSNVIYVEVLDDSNFNPLVKKHAHCLFSNINAKVPLQ